MTARLGLAVALTGLAAVGSAPGPRAAVQATALATDLDRIFDEPIFARALVGARFDSLATGETIYARNAARHVVPASNMKLVTLAVAADRLGWDYRYETRLEAAGALERGVLHGDLIVVGSGDPSIGSLDGGPAPLFAAWIAALRDAGIHRVDGRVLGDDDVFDDEGRGAGWAWDYLTAGYAAPTGGLSYNENVAVVRVRAGAVEGSPATVAVTPPGHGFEVVADAVTGSAGSRASLVVAREAPGPRLVVRGRVPAGSDPLVRTTAVDDPTGFFVGGFAAALADRGLAVTGGAWDLDEVADPPPAAGRRVIARHASPPLSVLAGRLMKDSQNFYAETLLKTVGGAAAGIGSGDAGRAAVRETLGSWGIPEDAVVVYDGSGLSRYNYVTADAIVTLLSRVWRDEPLRGPYVSVLPVGGRDGTLASRMADPVLTRRVQAKTGTIANVRALSGYLHRPSGDTVVFSVIANHFTAPSGRVDEAVERALARVVHQEPHSARAGRARWRGDRPNGAHTPPPPVLRESSR